MIFEHPTRAFGAHKTNCKLNPKRKEITEKQRKKLSGPRVKRIELIIRCLSCDKQMIVVTTERYLETGRYKKCCSPACGKRRKHSFETKALIGSKLRRPPKEVTNTLQNCVICQVQFERPSNKSHKTCSTVCRSKFFSQKLKGKTGGYKIKSGSSKFHGSWYKGSWMDSSWELAMAQRLDALNISWERGNRFFQYTNLAGEVRKYYPDFFLPEFNRYLEIKGYWTVDVRHKMNDVQAKNDCCLEIIDNFKKIVEWLP